MRVARHSKAIKRNLSGIREPDVTEPVSSHAASVFTETLAGVAPARPRGVPRVPVRSPIRTNEKRAYVRAQLGLPMQIFRVAGQRDTNLPLLRTENISSSGVYFFSPRRIEPGTPIELRVLLVDRPFGRASVSMRTQAHVVRIEETARVDWHGVAAAFDDITFSQDEPAPSR